MPNFLKMTEYSEDVYRELRTLIQVYANIEQQPKAIFCASCKKAFRETVSQHLARHIGQDFRWTSTPPPTYG